MPHLTEEELDALLDRAEYPPPAPAWAVWAGWLLLLFSPVLCALLIVAAQLLERGL